MTETNTLKKVDYIVLEVNEYLPSDKYKALLKCTTDGRSHWDPEKRVNIYYIDVEKIPEAEKVLGRKIRVERKVEAEVEGEIGEREEFKLDITYDIKQRILVVMTNTGNHVIPFDYVDFIWEVVKKRISIAPREIWHMLEDRFGLPRNTFFSNRKMYYAHYYWPSRALIHLGVIDQCGTGPLKLVREMAGLSNWTEALKQ